MANALANLFVTLSMDSGDFVSKIRAAQSEAKAAEDALSPLTKATKTFGQAATVAGGALSAAITAPIVALGTAAFAAGVSFDQGMDKIRSGTGATGTALKALEGDFRATLRSVPNDVNQVSTAITDLSVRTGLTGPPLQALSTQMLNLARITETDVGPLIASTTRVFGDWGVATNQQSSTLDYLFRTAQSTGIGVDTLAQKVVQFGAPLRQMGFDLDTSAALLGKFEKEGVNSELVMGSLRIALTRMAKEGVTDAGEALSIITERIKNAGSAGEANAIALGVFGARAGPDMAAAIREGRFEIDELVAKLRTGGDTINQAAKDTLSFTDALGLMKNRTLETLSPLGQTLADVFQNTALPLLDKAVTAVSAVIEVFNLLPQPVQMGVIALAGVAAAIGPVLIGVGQLYVGISGLVPIFLQWWGVSQTATLATTALGTAMTALATGGVVVLGAAIGILIGSFVNWMIEGTRVQGWLDAFTSQVGRSLHIIGDGGRSTNDLTAATMKLIETYHLGADALQRQGESQEAWNTRVLAMTGAADRWRASHSAAATATTGVKSALDSLDPATRAHIDAVNKQIDALTKSKDGHDKAAKAAAAHRDKIAQLSNFLEGAEDNLNRPIKQLNAGFALLDQTVTVVTPKIKSLFPPLISDMEMLNMALDSNIKFTQKQATDEAALAAARQRDLERYQQALKEATDDVKRSAGEIFDAMFIKGENVFSSLKNLLTGGALSLGRAIFEDIVGALLGPVKLAFDQFFQGLIDSTIGEFVKSLGSKLGGILPSIGGNAAQTAAGVAETAAGGVGGAGGAIGGAAGGAGGLGSGLLSGGLAAAGGIIGGWITKGNAKRTEENTREARDWLELAITAWDPLFNAMTIYLQQISDRLAPSLGDVVFTAAEGLRIGVYNALWEVASALMGVVGSGVALTGKAVEKVVEATEQTASTVKRAFTPAGTRGTPFLNYGVPNVEAESQEAAAASISIAETLPQIAQAAGQLENEVQQSFEGMAQAAGQLQNEIEQSFEGVAQASGQLPFELQQSFEGIAQAAGQLPELQQSFEGMAQAAGQLPMLQQSFEGIAQAAGQLPNLGMPSTELATAIGEIATTGRELFGQMRQEIETRFDNSELFGRMQTGLDVAPREPSISAPIDFKPQINVTIEGSNLTPLQIREQIIPEIVTVLDSGVRGFREKVVQIVTDSMEMPRSTPAVVGI